MPPPEPEEEPRPKPEPKPKPKPKPPKPKKAPEPGPKPKPMPARPVPRRDVIPGDGGSSPPELFCRDNCSGPCTLIPHCQPLPPPSAGTALKLTSSRLPTPLIAVSASLLVVCAVLLLALLVRCLVQRRRRMRAQNWPLAQHGEEGGQQQVLAGAVAGDVRDEDEELAADGGVHHVWYIRTKGLDERAIAAIAAVVYDAKKRGAVGGRDGDASCAVCLADFRDGETLRLLPRCGHAFHRGCIDTWLRAHVNCPLCRAPVQAASAAAPAPGTAAAAAAPRGEGDANLAAVGGVRTEQETARSGVPERAVRRAASMVALPRRAWPDLSFRAPTSNSGREEDMSGLGKIMRLLKLSDSLEMSGGGAGTRSVSFSAGSCQRLPTRSGPSAAGGSAEETSQ